MTNSRSKRIRGIVTIFMTFLGFLLIGLALAADNIGLDITPGFGVVQTVSLLVGLTLLTLAGYMHLYTLRPAKTPRSLQADIGIRLSATGLVLAYVTGLSDTIGIGTHINPNFDRPFIGPLQLGGLLLSAVMIVGGMVLYYTSRGSRKTSSLEFLVNGMKSQSPEHGPAENNSLPDEQ